jgi:CheY-like chemotaxis protein
MTGAATVRALIVDDHRVVCAGLTLMLRCEQGMESVAEAGSGREAIEMLRNEIGLGDRTRAAVSALKRGLTSVD